MTSKLKATQVFTPGTFPVHTYVERKDLGIEARLRDGLDVPGQLISLAGPSKSGKTVLVEKLVGAERLISLTGAGITSADELWDRVLDNLGEPHEMSASNTQDNKTGLQGAAKGEFDVMVVKTEVSGQASREWGKGQATSITAKRRGMTQVIEILRSNDNVLLLDDFHYIPREVQSELAQQLKEVVRLGVKVCVVSVPHRSEDIIRANPDLRGRVLSLDLAYWSVGELKKIGSLGFDALNAHIDDDSLKEFATEAAGSPQLMQNICLQACFVTDLRERADERRRLEFDTLQRSKLFEQTTTTTNYRTLVDVLAKGPKTRGSERLTYPLRTGKKGDVYRVILSAVALDPPTLSFAYDNILSRVKRICLGQAPVGSSIVGSCVSMADLARQFSGTSERPLDWDEQKQVLDVPDPYLVFYLRWSDHVDSFDESQADASEAAPTS